MVFSNETYTLRIEIDSKDFRLSPEVRAKMDADLETLRRAVAHFPVAELKVEINHPLRSSCRVATTLRLPSRVLFAADEDEQVHPAWERCIRRLVNKVGALKEKLSNKPVYDKQADGTLHEILPAQAPDVDAVERAVEELDYTAFRQAMAVYEEPLEGRVGRWVQRYPVAQDQMGYQLRISEIVEEVLLNAFDQYAGRPPLRLGLWLEQLIDPSVRALLERTDQEKENISLVQTAREAERMRVKPR